MASDDFEIESERLRPRPWRLSDGDDFARLNADTEVMADLGFERRPSLDFTQHDDGFGRWHGLVWSASSGWIGPPVDRTDGAHG